MQVPVIIIWISSLAMAVSFAESCEDQAQVAESVMTARQEGMPLRKSLSAVKKLAPVKFHPILELMVLEAYDRGLYEAREKQQQVIGSFGESWRLRCQKAR